MSKVNTSLGTVLVQRRNMVAEDELNTWIIPASGYPGCQRLFMRGFRFRWSLKKWPAPFVSSAFGRQNEAPRLTREKTSGTQGSLRNKRLNNWGYVYSIPDSSFTGRKTIPVRLLFILENGNCSEISVTEQSCAVQILKKWILAYRIGISLWQCEQIFEP